MTLQAIFNWLFLLSPLIAGSAIYFLKSQSAAGKVDRLDAWLIQKYETTLQKEGRFYVWVIQPLLWMLTRVMVQTESMPNAFLRSGIRIAAYGYITAITLYLVYFAVVVVLTIVILGAILYVISEASGNSNGGHSGSVVVESREREDFFGNQYSEHLDVDGRVVGTSREREGFFGNEYVEHQGSDGNVVGTSRTREGFFGDKYTEHQNSGNNVVGTSRNREGFFGDKYTENSDAEGNVTSTSREREGLLGGKYTETTHNKK